MDRRRGLHAGALAIAATLSLSACATTPGTTAPSSETASPDARVWVQFDDFPLEPRDQPAAAWTGSELLVLGGSTGPPCPPNASCIAGDPVADGAALDPETGTWRAIADAPMGLPSPTAVTVGDLVYVTSTLIADEQTLLSYNPAADTWATVDAPLEVGHLLVADGDDLLLVSASDEYGGVPDLVLDGATGEWAELPADPIGDAFNRMLTPTTHGLVLTAHDLVDNPGADGPSLTLAALFDRETQTWTRLPDTEQIADWPWAVNGDRLIAPSLGGADGGEIGNWGRVYPNGGVITLPDGAWEPLPNLPTGNHQPGLADAVGTHISVASGYLYDDDAGTWEPLPPVDDIPDVVRTTAWMGDRLLAFGGTAWNNRDGERLRSVWMLTP